MLPAHRRRLNSKYTVIRSLCTLSLFLSLCGCYLVHYHHKSCIRMACEVSSPSSLHKHAKTLKFSPTDSRYSYPLPELYPPLIYHIRADRDFSNLAELIHRESEGKLSAAYVDELVSFGAVYLAKANSSGAASPGSANRITIKDSKSVVVKGSYCRVHANPRRYFGGYGVTWGDQSRIRESGLLRDIIIVNKPFDLPSSSTVDNLEENLLYCIEKHRCSSKDKLYLSSRLDACTSGLILIPTSYTAARSLSSEIANRQVSKIYKVLCKSPTPPPIGLIQHCFRRKNQKHLNGKPTLLRPFDDESLQMKDKHMNQIWQDAQLRILSCCEVADDKINLQAIHRYEQLIEFDRKESNKAINPNLAGMDADRYYECIVQLLTGRTHQIRLQFAAINAPVVGDSRYEPVRGLLDESKSNQKPWGDGSSLFGSEPRVIGLQCHQLQLPRSLVSSLASDNAGDIDIHEYDTKEDNEGSISCRENSNGDLVITCGAPWWSI
jgi:23S rRNA-/tRNA-specific pseudouridylate synthase